jgi:energy-converting hydrogenase Eha subunit E
VASDENPVTRIFLAAQGSYYLLAGIWPLVSMGTFEAVTGPKTDDWLVRTVGLLAAAIGATLLFGARLPAPRAEAVALAVLAACAFASIDLVYGLSGVIRPVYLADAAVELFLALGAAVSSRRR